MAEGRKGFLALLLQGFVLLSILATLGIVIAVLVTTLNIQSKQNTAITPTNNNNNNNKNNALQDALNVPEPNQISQGASAYSSYGDVVSLLKQGLTISADPCQDFYKYTCGAWNGPMSFDVSDSDNFNKMAAQMLNTDYVSKAPSPVQQVVWYFNQCIYAQQNWNATVYSGSQAATAVASLMQGETPTTTRPYAKQTTWPMYDQKTSYTAMPDPYTLGFLLGAPTGTYGISTLVSAAVDTNWANPQSSQGYSYYIDQPSTMLPNTYYKKAWSTYQPKMVQSVIDTMNLYASTQGKNLSQDRLAADAADIVNFDYLLAMTFSTDDTTRRQYARSYNPMTISQLQAQYPFINWHEFIPLTVGPSDKAMMTVLMNKLYNFVVMEPAQLQKLNDLLINLNGNAYNVTANTVMNYIYYQQMSSQSNFLPWPTDDVHMETIKFHAEITAAKPLPGKRRHNEGTRKHKRRWDLFLAKDISDIQSGCAAETMEMLQYANARVFIDKIYPNPSDRVNIRNNVAKVASSILIGFRSMIDQLDWMTAHTKKGAYNKIDNLVKNIAYPDWITDDTQLTNYHALLGIMSNDTYLGMYNKAMNFMIYQQFELLAQGAANRIDFNGPPGTTNAWYQPEMNSITFPAAILRQPFYDPSWPASVNFGAMGVIAGHELTHGFDDEGVQWDGIGQLKGWMDASSQASFNNMSGCVVNEYNGFCPLNKNTYGAGACVDGAQTQGENIADNGGIHAAFRAYKNYINLNGPDPQLPDGALQGFTADQLFFLGFAQVWCQMTPSDAAFNRQILVDPHSPSIYRVWGTIQNFPAFKDAFHCPASAYAPDQHCNVWVSDISSSYGQPNTANDINVADQPQAVKSQPDTFNAYQQSVNYFQASVNFTADPCNDFWTYSCGNYDQLVSFHLADAANLVLMTTQLTDPNYQATIQSSTALTKEKAFFDQCVAITGNNAVNNQTLISKNYMKAKVDALSAKLGTTFTAVHSGPTIATLPNPIQLANGLGYLSFTQMIDTLVTPMVDTYWVDNSKGYQFFVDQNTAEKSKTYYAPAAFANIESGYVNSTTAVFLTYCKEQGLVCDPDTTRARVQLLIEFEQKIAYTYSTDDTTRRQYQRSWNLTTAVQMNTNYPFIDWPTYIKNVPTVAQTKVSAAGYQISVMEPAMISKLSTDIQNSKIFNPDTVVNYLYMRLLLDNAQYLPTYQSALAEMPTTQEGEVLIGKSRRPKLPKRRLVQGSDVTSTQTGCMSLANELMQFANGRVFIDYLYPTADSRTDIRNHAGGVINNIIGAFQGMLMQLDWMTAPDKSRAMQKTTQIKTNIAYPDWITNNAQLDSYYSQLVFAPTDNYYDMWDKLIQFTVFLQYQQLTFAQTDRNDFLGQPGTVNAWYQPELNSITFPAGILRPPYYNSLWPASVNYGGLGVVAGHELTHGFDDEGVQWGPTGNLAQWMNDKQSQDGFKNMSTCVVNEYNGFCPLNATQYTPNCVNGAQTQGENIADNGGIHAAFRAYRTHIQLNGPDPMLPDQMFGQFTHDQLFFLSFAQVWCEAYRGDDGEYRQLMVDPHSPSKYRVFGTIQNYPAFQTAYNCPANSAYAPSSHCNVWVPFQEA